LLIVAELDRREAWSSWGCRSMAHWLAWRCGVVPRTGREHLRVGHALRALPAIRERFAAGCLSYSQVRAMTRVATPVNERALLELAEHSTAAQLDRVVRAAGPEPRADRDVAASLYLDHEDGRWQLTGKGLPPEDGALVDAALRRLMDAEPHTTGDGGPAEPIATRRARALTRMAEIALAADLDDLPSSTGDRYQVLVVADEHGACLEPGPAIADATARRLACDAARTFLRTAQGRAADAGHTDRAANRRQRRALRHRDGGCRFPGCGRRAFLHAHHVVHWADGGPTAMDNLAHR
jgi:hypothetical protein